MARLFDVSAHTGNSSEGLPAVLSVNKHRAPVAQVEGYTGDPPDESLFADEFLFVLSQFLYDLRNSIHALVVGNDDQGTPFRHVLGKPEAVSGTQQVGAPHQTKVQDRHTFLMGIVPK